VRLGKQKDTDGWVVQSVLIKRIMGERATGMRYFVGHTDS